MMNNIFSHLVESNLDGFLNQLEELEFVDHHLGQVQPLHELFIKALVIYFTKVAKSTLHIKHVSTKQLSYK